MNVSNFVSENPKSKNSKSEKRKSKDAKKSNEHQTKKTMTEKYEEQSKKLTSVIKTFVGWYEAIINFMNRVKMLRSGAKPLNELTLEGLYMKEIEIFFFDFFDYKSWEKTKESLRCLGTSLVISLAFYLLATYLMGLDLRVRVIATCVISTFLTLLLSFSPATRVVTFLMVPSMASGNLRSALLLIALVLLSAGPISTLRSNIDTISASKACLHEQFFDIIGIVKSLKGRNLIGLLIIPLRLLLLAIQLVAEILYRLVHSIYMALEKLIATLKRFLKNVGKLLSKLKPNINFQGSCFRLIRIITRKFRRTRLLGGLVQMMASIINSVRASSGSPPLSKPTVGFFVHEIGTRVCRLLRKAKDIYREKKKKLTDWWQTKVLPKINEVKAVFRLIGDALSPESYITVTMTGGFAHKLADVKTSMRKAVDEKAREIKQTFNLASLVIKNVSSALSLIAFSITLVLSIQFYRSYMLSDDFENIYITAPFLRLEELEPPVLPLDQYEKTRISVMAESMIRDVARQLGSSTILITVLRVLPFVIVMLLNWIFYFMASFMESRWNQAIEIERNVDTRLTMKTAKGIAKESPMALLLTIMIHMQKALREINLDINVLACSPKASEPNWTADILIGSLLTIYTVFTLFGPFFLKLRHHIMLEMEPVRSVQRAVWLRRQIEADRRLLPNNRDLLKLTQMEQQNSSMMFVFNAAVKASLATWTGNLRSMFNLPTIRCARCGVRGNMSLPNFNQFFTVCDSCNNSICSPCAHYTDENGVVRLRAYCPNCGLKMEDVEIDAEEIEEEDPLDHMLSNFLDLRPGYKISRSALKEHMKEIRKYAEKIKAESSRSFMNLLGKDAEINPNA